jgi:hypothetical protein
MIAGAAMWCWCTVQQHQCVQSSAAAAAAAAYNDALLLSRCNYGMYIGSPAVSVASSA